MFLWPRRLYLWPGNQYSERLVFIDASCSLLLAVLSRRHKCAESTGRNRPVKRSEHCPVLLSELGAASDARDSDS